jgi:murein DD-endopeptidase MepM/ murein hydrolase activator NlpD
VFRSRNKIGRLLRSRSDHAVRAGIMSALAFGIIVAGLYLYMVPGASANIPFSGPLGVSHLDSGYDGCPVVGPEETLPKTELQSGPCSQEMVDLTGEGDTLYSLLNANLLDEVESRKIAVGLAAEIEKNLNKSFDANTPLEPGRSYGVTLDQNGNFLKATVELNPADVFHAAVEGLDIRCWKEDVVLDYKIETISFRLDGTLEKSLMKIGEGAELARKLFDVFRWDIDFQAECVRGDTCKILFERRYADDRPSGYGRILAALYDGKKTGKKVAILFNNQYYDTKATELKKNFLRSPLSGVIRITSRFGMRFHPIYRRWRHHDGTDYGAAKGTPAFSIAKGVVTFAGWQGNYGNLVCIKHDNGYESKYGHLLRILVKKGDRLKQHDRIGLVGQTGDATAPHLHFELLVKSKNINPLGVKYVNTARLVPEALRSRFASICEERLAPLEQAVILIKTADRGSATITR